MAYHPLKKFKRKELREELDILVAEQLNAVIRGEITSDDAREAFFQVIDGRFRGRASLKHRKQFQRSLLLVVLGGIPSPAEDDMDLALEYLRRRVTKGSLSLAEAKDHLTRALRLAEPAEQERWHQEFEADLLGPGGVALSRASARR